MANPLEPKYWVIYGDGYDAKSPGFTKEMIDGKLMIRIKIKPTRETAMKYDIKNEDFNKKDGFLHKNYDELDLVIDNHQEGIGMLIFACDIHGKNTGFFDKIDTKYRMQAEQWRNAFQNSLKRIARLEYDLRKALEQPEEREELQARKLVKLKKVIGHEYITGPIQQPLNPEEGIQ